MAIQLIGRTEEIKTLNIALASNRPEMIAVVGRRRVGKTFFIKQTYGQQIDFELTGIQHATKSEQLQNFLFALRNYFPDFYIEQKPKTWFLNYYFWRN